MHPDVKHHEAPSNESPYRLGTEQGALATMQPPAEADGFGYVGAGRLTGKVALVTGADGGVGRNVAIAFAKEGAHLAIAYLDDDEEAQRTCAAIEAEGKRCMVLGGDVGDAAFCTELVEQVRKTYGRVDVLVNNAAESRSLRCLEEVSHDHVERMFRTNVFSMFELTRQVLALMKPGARIVNTASFTSYRGGPHAIDYSATHDAIASFTRALSRQLVKRQIRVVAAEPEECARRVVMLATRD